MQKTLYSATERRYLSVLQLVTMLRPSFRKHFLEDNFSEISNIADDGNAESFTDASSVSDTRTSTTISDGGAFSKREIETKSVQRNSGESNENAKDPLWDSDRSVYELQLNQLQEQLVETMVENQQLGEELRQLKEKGKIDSLKNQLEEEKKKTKRLEEKLKKLQPKRPPNPSIKEMKKPLEVESGRDAWEDLTTVADNTVYPENVLIASGIASANSLAFAGTLPASKDGKHDLSRVAASKDTADAFAPEPTSKFVTFKIKAWNMIHDRISDFLNDEAAENEQEKEDEPLAIKRLRENVSRFSDGILPIRRFISAFRRMLNWTNPWFSLSCFVIYLYSIWLGCFIPLVIFLAILKLSKNYLYAKGIAEKFGYQQKKAESEEEKTEVTSWSERYQLVLQIARKVQNTLGDLADTLEKFESLFTWRHDEATKKLYIGLWIAFLVTLILPSRYFYLPLGFGVGIKLFVVSPIYKRFPKVQKRYDNIDRLWNELPTREEPCVEKSKHGKDELDGSNRPHSPTIELEENAPRSLSRSAERTGEASVDSDASNALSWSAIIFCDRFHLPQTEVQLPGWEDGRRCTLFNRDSPLSNMKHGRLYLTKNYLCFERNQFHSKKNFALRLHDITEIQKAKSFSFIPGGGMSIEVTTKTNEKPFLFGAMMGRDEAYESILRAARALNLSWGRKF